MVGNWSDERVALTRKHVGAMQGTAPGARVQVCMKHWNDRHGLLLVEGAQGALVVADVTSGAREAFASPDDLIAAGWVLD